MDVVGWELSSFSEKNSKWWIFFRSYLKFLLRAEVKSGTSEKV